MRPRAGRERGSAVPPTVSARMLRVCAEALERKGFDVASFLKRLSLERAALDDVDGRVSIDADLALWDAAPLISGDDDFGLHAGTALRPEAFDLLGYTLASSGSVGDAFRCLVRYNGLLHDVAEVDLREGPEEARLCFSLTPEGTPRQQAEFSFAVFLSFCRNATGVDVAPVRVEFSHVAPADISEHKRIFRAPLLFEKATNTLVFPAYVLDLPLLNANPGLCAVLERQLNEQLADQPSGETMLERVKRLIAAELCGGDPTAEAVSGRMRATPRTLHRWLSAEGTSYREILNGVRRDLALRYLTEDGLAIGEAAHLLGFSDPSAFHRSFKRWTGKTPAEYRTGTSTR